MPSERVRWICILCTIVAITGHSSSLYCQDLLRSGGVIISVKDSLITPQNDTLLIVRHLLLREKDTLMLMPVMNSHEFDSLKTGRMDIVTKIDTVLIRQDTLFTKSEKILRNIQRFSQKNNLLSKMLRNVLVFENKAVALPTQETPPPDPELPYEAHRDKIIRNVDISVLDVFGGGIEDPEKKPSGFIQKGGNLVHIKSQKWLIRNKLLFAKGDKLESLKIAESERLLRTGNYIYDAKIIVREIPDSDSVDVAVIVQDIWSISGGAGYNAGNQTASFSLRDVNFLGFGQQFSNVIHLNPLFPRGYHYQGNYFINNIYRTMTSGHAYYGFNNGLERYGLGVNREFITPTLKWIGGANYNRYELWPLPYVADSFHVSEKIRGVGQDYWLGRALKLHNRETDNGDRLMLSARLIKNSFENAPAVEGDPETYPYHSSDFYLANAGYIHRKFYKDHYIFRLGRTEDIPEGYMLYLTGGMQNRPIGNRPYSGISGAWSRAFPYLGYFYMHTGAGGFFNEGWEQGVFYSRFLYFTPLIHLNRWKWRNYLSLRLTEGINRRPGEFVNLNRENGLRGFSAGELFGTRKFVMNYETNYYPPFNIVGFRMAFVMFADLGWISMDNSKLLTWQNFFPGYGIGFRLKNEHLVFNMIQVMLGYYPNAGKFGRDPFLFFQRNRFFYTFNDFNFVRPGPEAYY